MCNPKRNAVCLHHYHSTFVHLCFSLTFSVYLQSTPIRRTTAYISLILQILNKREATVSVSKPAVASRNVLCQHDQITKLHVFVSSVFFAFVCPVFVRVAICCMVCFLGLMAFISLLCIWGTIGGVIYFALRKKLNILWYFPEEWGGGGS